MIAVSHHAQGVSQVTIDQFGCRNEEVKKEDVDQDLFYGGIGIHGVIIVYKRGERQQAGRGSISPTGDIYCASLFMPGVRFPWISRKRGGKGLRRWFR